MNLKDFTRLTSFRIFYLVYIFLGFFLTLPWLLMNHYDQLGLEMLFSVGWMLTIITAKLFQENYNRLFHLTFSIFAIIITMIIESLFYKMKKGRWGLLIGIHLLSYVMGFLFMFFP